MKKQHSILILGASYGSLLASKLLLAGHSVKLVCLQSEADLINTDGIRVRLPVKGRPDPVEISFSPRQDPISADVPSRIDPVSYDLAVLAMQEPQYAASGVRELLNEIAIKRVPCMSIMNMPPPPYLKRLPAIEFAGLQNCFTDVSVWQGFEPGLVTLCSPDAQAFRPADEPSNVLQVSLPSNFKAAPFASTTETQMLRRLQSDIEAIRWTVDGAQIELPVKLKVHDSLFVPLAKWSMLIAGNYRCIQQTGTRSIREAVHGDLSESQRIYEWVGDLCRRLGASEADQVPFDKYAAAALKLGRPSSVARALFAGALAVERVDSLVQRLAAANGMQCQVLDQIVKLVDARLQTNRLSAVARVRQTVAS